MAAKVSTDCECECCKTQCPYCKVTAFTKMLIYESVSADIAAELAVKFVIAQPSCQE